MAVNIDNLDDCNVAKKLVFLARILKKIAYKKSDISTVLFYANN